MTIHGAAHPTPSGTRRLRRVLLVGLVALLVMIGHQAPVLASPTQAEAAGTQPVGLYAPKGRPQAAGAARSPATATATQFFYAQGADTRGSSHPTGAQATLTVHRPALRGDHHALAELAVSSANGQSIVEVGWTVDPDLYGDTQPRVFVYHWVNGGETCYNGCGFVATNPALLGGVLPVGGQRQVVINHVVAGTDRWTISIGPPGAVQQIGYFPDWLWNSFTEPDVVQAFGEVAAVSSQPCARMGTGGFPTASSGAQIYSVSFLGAGAPAVNLTTQALTPAFYRVVRTSATSLRYGGPGAYPGVPPAGSACKVTVPYVLHDSRTVAANRVLQAGLVPVFTGAGGPGEPWVFSQSPAPFTEVAPGSEVRMQLRSGPIP